LRVLRAGGRRPRQEPAQEDRADARPPPLPAHRPRRRLPVRRRLTPAQPGASPVPRRSAGPGRDRPTGRGRVATGRGSVTQRRGGGRAVPPTRGRGAGAGGGRGSWRGGGWGGGGGPAGGGGGGGRPPWWPEGGPFPPAWGGGRRGRF